MAHQDSNTYMAIPPPPLREFYLSERLRKTSLSGTDDGAEYVSAVRSSSSRHCDPPALDGIDERYGYTKTSAHSATIKVHPPPRSESELPSLAVYHICRICLRPRSARYHREHPIPNDGVPPPPSICRRCRITPADDHKSVTEIIEQPESSEVKLGVRCLVPEEDYFRHSEMRDEQPDFYVRRSEWRELEPVPQESRPKEKTEVIHRHVHISVPPPRPRSARDAPSVATKTSSVSKASRSEKIKSSEKAIQPELPPPPPPAGRVTAAEPSLVQRTQASMPTHESISISVKSRNRSSSHQATYTSASSEKASRPGHTDSEIRKLAREEVERYRQAERRMEAHESPYAHGRLVPIERIPVERRIEMQPEVQPMPWKRSLDNNAPRKDSAFALASAQVERKEVEAIKVKRTEKKSRTEDTWRSVTEDARPQRSASPPPSSLSSDKTRWPAATQSRQYRVEEVKSPTGNIPARATSTQRKYEVVEVVDNWESDVRHPATSDQAGETYYKSSLVQDSDSSTRSKPSKEPGSGHLVYSEPVRANEKASSGRVYRMEVAKEKQQVVPSSRNETAEGRPRLHAQQQVQKTVRTRIPPYPEEDGSNPVLMPSPSSHASKARTSPAKTQGLHDDDREYYYVRRTVQPVDRSATKPLDDSKDDYYRETQEYLHRRRTPGDSQTSKSQSARPEQAKRRPSDASSRVRFSNKVEISPTPPNSDANSSEFRSLGQSKPQRGDRPTDRREDLIAEYEHRGRPRSRDPAEVHGYYYERDTIRSHERGYRTDINSDRDRTPRPAARGRQSGSSETATGMSTLPSNMKGFARVLSESPSREKLIEEARKQRISGAGPYVI